MIVITIIPPLQWVLVGGSYRPLGQNETGNSKKQRFDPKKPRYSGQFCSFLQNKAKTKKCSLSNRCVLVFAIGNIFWFGYNLTIYIFFRAAGLHGY